MKKSLIKFAVYTFIYFISEIAYASTQGILGTTSDGSSNLQVIVPVIYNLTGLQNFNLGNASPPYVDITQNQNICVYTNDPSGQYNVRIQSTLHSSGTAFYMEGAVDSSQQIGYQVIFNNSATPGQTQFENGQTLTAQTGANIQNQTCAIGPMSANLMIKIPANNLKGVPAQTYTDTLTIIIE